MAYNRLNATVVAKVKPKKIIFLLCIVNVFKFWSLSKESLALDYRLYVELELTNV